MASNSKAKKYPEYHRNGHLSVRGPADSDDDQQDPSGEEYRENLTASLSSLNQSALHQQQHSLASLSQSSRMINVLKRRLYALLLGFLSLLGSELPHSESEVATAHRSLFALLFYLSLAVCLIAASVVLSRLGPSAEQSSLPGARNGATISTGKNGAVAADNPVCSALGVSVLRDELNATAADAAVTVVLCQGVLSPFASGLGGGFFATIYNARNKTAYCLDAREVAPAAASPDLFIIPGSSARGGLSIAVPGELQGLYMLHQRFGNVEWEKLVNMVVPLANESAVSPFLHVRLRQYIGIIKASESLKSLFAIRLDPSESATSLPSRIGTKDDADPSDTWQDDFGHQYRLLREGDTIRQPRLAETLAAIARNGVQAIYDNLASSLAADIRQNHGVVSEDDIRQYKAFWREPLSYFYNGMQILAPPPPSSGGAVLGLVLNVLEGYQLKSLGRNSQSWHLVVEALKFAFGDRMLLADPDKVPNITSISDMMIDKQYAMKIRSKVSTEKTFEPPYYAKELAELEDSGTSHISIIDKFDNAISLTSTVNLPFGSGIISQSTGILLNDQMDDFSTANASNTFDLFPSKANQVEPGKRPLSSMSPLIVLKNNEVYLALGASGGPKIITSTLHAFLSIVEFGDDIATAISSPRIHHQLVPNVVSMESVDITECGLENTYAVPWVSGSQGISYWSEICQGLKNIGHELKSVTEDEVGCVQIVLVTRQLDGSRSLSAASDPRKMGKAESY